MTIWRIKQWHRFGYERLRGPSPKSLSGTITANPELFLPSLASLFGRSQRRGEAIGIRVRLCADPAAFIYAIACLEKPNGWPPRGWCLPARILVLQPNWPACGCLYRLVDCPISISPWRCSSPAAVAPSQFFGSNDRGDAFPRSPLLVIFELFRRRCLPQSAQSPQQSVLRQLPSRSLTMTGMASASTPNPDRHCIWLDAGAVRV